MGLCWAVQSAPCEKDVVVAEVRDLLSMAWTHRRIEGVGVFAVHTIIQQSYRQVIQSGAVGTHSVLARLLIGRSPLSRTY